MQIVKEIEKIYKSEYGRVLAVLLRLLSDIDMAEEALQSAFVIALEKWQNEGIPENPYSWLISTAKFKAIDSMRRAKRGREILEENTRLDEFAYTEPQYEEEVFLEDDQLRLIFLCCHPALPLDSRIALSLRDVCGMKTEKIARAYLSSPETIKKRISRAKKVFRENKLPLEIPRRPELQARINAVLHVIYLIYNEGYSASAGEDRIRNELCSEAVFLSRSLVSLAGTPESMGLLSLLLLQESRKKSRITETGDLIPLEYQDRSLWDQALIREGSELLRQVLLSGRLGPYALQAAIASVHAAAGSIKETRWDLIVGYYDMLLSITPSPVIELNRAIAVGMQEGPQAGLAIINTLIEERSMKSYHLLYAAQADFLKRLNLPSEAVKAYSKAIEFTRQEPERRYLKNQLAKIL